VDGMILYRQKWRDESGVVHDFAVRVRIMMCKHTHCYRSIMGIGIICYLPPFYQYDD